MSAPEQISTVPGVPSQPSVSWKPKRAKPPTRTTANRRRNTTREEARRLRQQEKRAAKAGLLIEPTHTEGNG